MELDEHAKLSCLCTAIKQARQHFAKCYTRRPICQAIVGRGRAIAGRCGAAAWPRRGRKRAADGSGKIPCRFARRWRCHLRALLSYSVSSWQAAGRHRSSSPTPVGPVSTRSAAPPAISPISEAEMRDFFWSRVCEKFHKRAARLPAGAMLGAREDAWCSLTPQ